MNDSDRNDNDCGGQANVEDATPMHAPRPTTPHIEPPTMTTSTSGPAASDNIDLSENFYINRRKRNLKILVRLTREGVYLHRQSDDKNDSSEQLIPMADVIGAYFGPRLKKGPRRGIASCRRHAANDDDDDDRRSTTTSDSTSGCSKDTSAYLYIYAYIKREKPALRRVRTVRILRFRSYDRYEENLHIAEQWYSAIKTLQKIDWPTGQDPKKPLLILLNPKSGSGKGRNMFHQQMAPVLKEAEMPYDLQVTTHANFARLFVRSREDLTQRYSGIVVASGDGLFYEVLNGLMERPDWYTVTRQLPLGIVPCGSGNGLAASIAYLYNEPYDPKPIMNATLSCVARKTTPMDIVRVEVAKGNQHTEMYSFLSVGWGLIADVDIESERLRSLGAPRFTLWTIHRLVSLRTYKGKLFYLPWCKPDKESVNDIEIVSHGRIKAVDDIDEPVDEIAEECVEMRGMGTKGLNSEQFRDVLENDIDDDVFVDAMSQASYRTNANSWCSAISRRTAYYSIAGQSVRSHRSITASMQNERIKMLNEKLYREPPNHEGSVLLQSTIPPLNLPITGDEWIREEGDYIMVHAAYTSHLASDCVFAPDSRLNDGIIYLVIIRSGVGRQQLMQFLLNLSTGSHLPTTPNPHIQVVPVRAFRIEPDGSEGILTVDGERVMYGPIQAEIFPGVINVMVPKNNDPL